jgi:AAA15 family ATPase/GTPase
MLLRFCVSNFKSIRDEAELSFIATALKEDPDQLIPTRYSKYGVLPVVSLYGANASGKSNILVALEFMHLMVLSSFKHAEDSEMPHRPFLLDNESESLPSSFILDFVLEDIRYQYGVTQSKHGVHDEWLYAFPKLIKQVLFTRRTNDSKPFNFGRSFIGGKQIQTITPQKALFLSVGSASGHDLLVKISSFFKNNISFCITENKSSYQKTQKLLDEDKALARDVVLYLGMADVGITDLRIKKTEMSEHMKPELANFFSEIKKIVATKSNTDLVDFEKRRTLELGHVTKDGTIKYLNFSDESLGTKHLFKILPSILLALRHGGALILDEITTSLHTLLARKLVSVFQNKELNPHGAQLVFSTHDTNLLAPGILRRDQIWFTEKSSSGDTSLFPLTDIKTKNTDNIEKGYVQGRFGAIPFIGSA